MKTNNKLKKKSMKIIITMMLAVVFLIGEVFSPFAIRANADTLDLIKVVNEENNPIVGAVVTLKHKGNGPHPIEQCVSGTDGILKDAAGGNIILDNGATDIIIENALTDIVFNNTKYKSLGYNTFWLPDFKDKQFFPNNERHSQERIMLGNNDGSLTLNLTQNPTAPTNTDVIITATGSTTANGTKIEGIKVPDGTTVNKATTQYSVSDNGTYTFTVIAKHGNTETKSIKSIIVSNIDRVAPDKPTISIDSTKKITITPGTDNVGGSGVKEVQYQIWNSNVLNQDWAIYTQPFNVNLSNFTVKAKTIDNAGNESLVAEQIFNLSTQGIKMEVSDSSGTINEKYDSTINGLDYNVDNNGEVYKLYGQSNVAIDVQDANATHIKYRFLKDGQDPTEEDWEYMELNGVNGDVDTTKSGYLTQMPYDVSHMPLLTNNAIWSNRNEVYKTPFADKTGPISTGITSANTQYVTSENVRDKDGKSITRWVPKTLFVENQSVGAYANGYKEARKTWGYIKVDQTGDYYFKPYSDDGFYGTITVNGELKVLGDDFRPRGINYSGLNATNAIHLEAGIYYPMYLEYFNWGGSAAFKIDASLNNVNNYKLIGSSDSHCTLYPSKSDSPIENGNNIFMGSSTINFKTEPGIYTIQYALLKEKNTSTATQKEYDIIPDKSGKFGKFEVEERFEGLSEAFSKERVQQGETFNINYTVKPKSIKLTDLYKGKDSSNKPNSLYIKNLILSDELPQGLVLSDNTSSRSVNKVTNIEYKYNSQTSEYKANEYVFSVGVKLTSQNLSSVNFNKPGQIDYRDVSLKDDSRISQTQKFANVPTFGADSLITKHGLYNGNEANITESNKFNVSDGIPVTLAMIVEANSLNPAINLSTDASKITQGTIEFKMYKISDSDDGAIDTNVTPAPVSLNNTGNINLTGLRMESGHKYLIVYTVTPVGSGETAVTATADKINTKSVDLSISPQPDLF